MRINKIVVKVASRCNINCSYCYMYNLGDLSYKSQPKFIEEKTIESFAKKMLTHLKKTQLGTLGIIIHGGEPLLMKKSDFINFIKHFDIIKENNIQVSFALQTNGILLDDEWCTIFKEYGVSVGVSLDGPKQENDKFRIDKKGNGTYDDVIKGLTTLKNNNFTTGVLSVMNLSIDPEVYYKHFKNLELRAVDVLLLDANHDTHTSIFNDKITPAQWYIKVFDTWYKDEQKFRIRFFDMIIKEIIGETIGIDSLGVSENNVLVLETNGGLEAVDVLKLCGDSFTKNDINVNTHEIEEISKSDLIDVYYNSGKYLPKKCLACPVQEICGGGYLPHRYSSKNGFNNPTIYCDDLLQVITHIQNTVIDSLPNELLLQTGLSKLTYGEALEIIAEKLPTIPEPDYIEKLESFKKSSEHELRDIL
ncbi:radical SAM protein [Flavobacterium sp. ANB]|uniref:radical SAM protein n=1 Tax=unclassified Flavobacterium TaxID=196869 RepID=UPI00188BDAB8|nr:MULTISPECIES: radical SAM protein [unclassified Flavobacterium]MBF4519158.1 radical SAM protein [Flavobacterium sp. ANB]